MSWKIATLILLPALAAGCAWAAYFFLRLRRKTRASQQLITGLLQDRERERNCVASELHSNLGQNLLILKNRAELALNADGNKAAVRDQLTEISRLCSVTIAEARQLAHGLGPRHLSQIGLTGALDAMVDRVAAASDIRFTRRLEPVEDSFDAQEELHVYRVAQEALNNVLKHSRARSVKVELIRDLSEVRLCIEDDGCGIAPATNGARHAGLGLAEMRERIRILGGQLRLENPVGRGTRVLATIPIRETTRVGPRGSS